MPDFEMPEFYMPYVARCNVHLATARVHAVEWATQMGMLNAPSGTAGEGVWEQQEFDSVDFALYAALVYPDVSAAELDLLTDWHVWAWFLDDFFPKTYTHSKDSTGGKEFISRVATYMSTDGTAVPAPTNPVEAGLADLWPRTVDAASADWRRRLADIVLGYLQHTPLEIYNAEKGWVPNPINYVIDVRRNAGGMELVACLVEHAHGVEIPSVIASTRAMHVLRDTFADGVDLRNDILSYQKEARAGEVNGVMIAQQFLDCDLQRAIDVVNDLATSRMQQFENTMIVELPLLFEDCLRSPMVRVDVLSWVKGLQDCMAGDMQWAKASVRYKDTDSPTSTSPDPPADPHDTDAADGRDGAGHEELPVLLGLTGLGTAAARLGLVRRAASVAWPATGALAGGQDSSRAELPDFYMPFHVECNPHLDAARVCAKAWAVEMGMLGSGLPDWDEAGFDRADPAHGPALLYPNASRPDMELAGMWSTWGCFLGDFSDEVFRCRRDLAGAKATFDRLPAFMPISGVGPMPAPINPLERGLADLWPRTAPHMSEDWRRWLSVDIQRTCEGLLWEILNLIENRIPDPVDYIEMRRQTSGVQLTVTLMHYFRRLEISPEVHDAGAMEELVEALLDWYGLVNDIFSYNREIEREGEVHNAVLILQRFLDCDLPQAVALANALATSQLRHFEYVATTTVPAFVDDLGLDGAGRDTIASYVKGLQDNIAGFYQAFVLVKSSRYGHTTGPESVPIADPSPVPVAGRSLFGPSGLGTSAATTRWAPEAYGRRASVSVLAPPCIRPLLGPTGIGNALARIGSVPTAGVAVPALTDAGSGTQASIAPPPELPSTATAAEVPDSVGADASYETQPVKVSHHDSP